MIQLLPLTMMLNCIYIRWNGCSPDIGVLQILNLIEYHTVACTFSSRYLRGFKGHALILCIFESCRPGNKIFAAIS